MKLKRAALGAVALISACFATSAHAQAPAVAYNWSGFYVGGNAGGAWLEDRLTQTPSNATTNAFFTPCFVAGTCTRDFGAADGFGAIAGIQGGYNWQMQQWVVGVEADVQWSSLSAQSSVNIPAVPGFNPYFGTANTDLLWFGTVRGKVGYLVTPSTLVYATGGYAYGDVQRSWVSGFPINNQVWRGISRQGVDGWTFGGGVEFATAARWMLAVEYLYVALDAGSVFSASSSTGGCPVGFCDWTVSGGDLDTHIARLKLSYKLF